MIENQENAIRLCPYCGKASQFDAVELWAGRQYCRTCIHQVTREICNQSIVVSPLSESISPNEIRASTFIKRYGQQLIVALAVFPGIPALVCVILNPDAWVASVIVVALFGGCGAFILLIQALIGAKVQRAQLPRTVTVDGDSLAITKPTGNVRVPLRDCRWFYGSTSGDMAFAFTATRRAVILVTPTERIACGRTAQVSDQWKVLLTLERIPLYCRLGCFTAILLVILGAFAGGTLGFLLGKAIAGNDGGHFLVAGLLILGVIDGGTAVGLYLTSTFDGFQAARKRLHPAMLGILFFLLGMKCNAIGGLPAALSFGAANSLVGLCIGWLCRRRIKQVEEAGQIRLFPARESDLKTST